MRRQDRGFRRPRQNRRFCGCCGFAKPEFGFIALTVLFFVASTAVSLVIPFINRHMVDDYIRNPEASALLAGFLGVVLSLLAVNLAGRLFSMARTWFLTVAGNRLVVRLRDTVFRRVQELSVGSVYRMTSGELMKRVNGDTNRIKNFIVDVLPNILEQGLLLLAVSIYLFWVDWRLALLILLPAPLITLAFRMFRRFFAQLARRTRDLNARGDAVLHDVFSGIRVVKAYGMEKREEERFVSMAAAERDAQLRQEKVWAILMPILNFVMGFGELILLYYVGSRMIAGEMTAGEMSQLSSYAGMIYTPLAVLIRVPRQLALAAVSLSNVFGLLDAPNEIVDSATPTVPTEVRGDIVIDRVSFGYGDGDEILHDISLHIAPGEFIGLVGRSGVGKSTLINLLMRMYDVDDGAILLDGVDIRDIPQAELRRRIGVVLGGIDFYPKKRVGVITDVTRRFYSNWDEKKYRHYLELFAIDESKRVDQLSSGMKVKYMIALALSHGAELLLLDEPTSGLDPVSRDELVELFRHIVADGTRSILFSTHITSDLEKCASHIAFIKDGEMLYNGGAADFRERFRDKGETMEDIIVAVERRELDDSAII